MARSERLYLQDIVEAADAIARYLDGRSRDAFLDDEVLCDAVLLRLITIGEAAARVASDTRRGHPDVPWSDVVGFRNIAVHAYFGIDWDIVWRAATSNAPRLRSRIAAMLASDDAPADDPTEPD